MKNIFILVLVFLGVILWQAKTQIERPGPLDDTSYVVITKGSSSASVAQTLFDAGVINNTLLFKLTARLYKLDKGLKAGEYVFEKRIPLSQVIQKLANGDVFYRKITLAEGLTVKQMLQIILDEENLSGDITIGVKEGELLPETYSFARGDSKDSLILQAKKAMQKALKNAWENRQEKLPLKNSSELLTLASIIEKETAIESERGLVASVFVNRLIKGMKLQTDPTVIYALTMGQKDLNRLLTRKDLTVDSPYNTYKYYGLPPAPICNPGKASLNAAANPDISHYLYFVANGEGGHNFATSLEEHNTNVQAWKKAKK